MSDRNALSHWFPRIEAAGLPVPRTTLVEMNAAAYQGICDIFDRKAPNDEYRAFIKALEAAAIGDPHRVAEAFPLFLRSDYTSAKHEWSRACFVTNIPAIKDGVEAIAYFSMCVGCPLPIGSKWAVRELLPIMPVTWCPEYGGMPVNREFRFFADENGARAWQPYWAEESLMQGRAPNRSRWHLLWEMSDEEMVELRSLAERAAKAAGSGEWSVDLLETERGWYVTDMAAADSSYRSDQMRPLVPALSALSSDREEEIRREDERAGLKRAIQFVEKRRDDYVNDVGVYDYSTGVTEFPGNGDETVGEWDEMIEGLKALLSPR